MKWVLRILPILLLGLLLVSCDRNTSSNPGQSGTVATPQYITATISNNISSFKNQIATSTITATVTDNHGAAVQGQRVQFSVTQHKNPITSIAADNNTDTTDATGKVTATLTVYPDSVETITVTATLVSNSQIYTTVPIQVLILDEAVNSFRVEFGKPVLIARQGSRDTTTVIARVLDDRSSGIKGMIVDFRVDSSQYAQLSMSYGTTDDNGEVRVSVWNNLNKYSENVLISATIRGLASSNANAKASGILKIRPLTLPADIHLAWVSPSDTSIYALPGEVIFKKFIIWCTDSSNIVIPSVPIVLSVAGTGSCPYVTATSTFGRDTIEWSSDGMTGRTTITAAIAQSTTFSSNGPLNADLDTKSAFERKLPSQFRSNGIRLLSTDEVNSSSTSITLVVNLPPSVPRIEIRFPSGNILYSTGRDSIPVAVSLLDYLDQGIPNATLNFAARYGNIVQTAVTGLDGAITVYIKDGGAIEPDSNGVILTVRYPVGNITKPATFHIRELLPIQSITLQILGGRSHPANPRDTVSVRANVFLSNGNYAYDSTQVHWEVYRNVRDAVVRGMGQFQNTITKTINGTASNIFVMNEGIGEDSLVAWVENAGTHTVVFSSGSNIISHDPGNPTHVYLAPRTLNLVVNGPAATVGALVRDTSNNAIRNPQLVWGTSIGTIVSSGVLPGDTVATAQLSAGANAGIGKWWVTTLNGISDTLTFNVIASTPRVLSLSAESQLIQVAGTGGNENTIIHAIVRDGNGNAVSNGVMVQFKITNGISFLQGDTASSLKPNFGEIGVDSTISETSGSGEAIATLSSGTRSGSVVIEAVVLNNDYSRTSIVATMSSVQIVAGPPARVTLGVNNENGTQEGGGTWSIWVNATVRDQYTNPVRDMTVVQFRVAQIGLAQVGLDTSATGNLGPTNQRIHGIAFTRLSYQSAATFDTLKLFAICNGLNELVSDSITFALPLQSGNLQLNITPSTFFFSANPETDRATHMAWAIVRDGYGNRISRAPVIFDVQRGKIFKTANEASTGNYAATYRASDNSQSIAGTNPVVYMPVNKQRTGNFAYPTIPALGRTDVNGMGAATVYIGGRGPSLAAANPVGEIFLDATTLETNSEVTCRVEGYPSVQSARFVINYQRSPNQ